MAGRKTRPEDNRRRWHTARIGQADTPKGRLWALCGWLVAEAWRTGRIAETTEHVKNLIDELNRTKTEGGTR